jgi:hypothetical protein
MNDRGATTTSSPEPMPSARSAASSASEPLAIAIACPSPHHAANSFSNSRHSRPVQNLTRLDRTTCATASTS